MAKRKNHVPKKRPPRLRPIRKFRKMMVIFMRWESVQGGRAVAEDVRFCCSHMAASLINHRINSLYLKVIRKYDAVVAVAAMTSVKGGEQVWECSHCHAEVAVVDRDNNNKRWQ